MVSAPLVVLLIAACAVCFALRQRFDFLHRWTHRWAFFEELFSCTFCLGFHCGWVVWLIYALAVQQVPLEGWGRLELAGSTLLFGLAAASVCYVADLVEQILELFVKYLND